MKKIDNSNHTFHNGVSGLTKLTAETGELT